MCSHNAEIMHSSYSWIKKDCFHGYHKLVKYVICHIMFIGLTWSNRSNHWNFFVTVCQQFSRKICNMHVWYYGFNSLCPSDAIWRNRTGSALAQVMACCLTAPSHYLNQCWLIINKGQWHSDDGNFTMDTSVTNLLKLAWKLLIYNFLNP